MIERAKGAHSLVMSIEIFGPTWINVGGVCLYIVYGRA